ncbi:hypothetical protein [Sphingomonas sp.]|uniref:hypothetical protein n=1 Tax=Sphingomonas sp. TaxID=28214 RepID=UPI003B3A6755
MYDELLGLRQAIGRTLDRIEGAVVAGGAEGIATLGRSRWQLGQQLHRYHAFALDRILPAFEPRQDEKGDAARNLRQRCEEAAACFADHVTTWDVVSMLDRWADYRAAALACLVQLRTKLEQQCREVALLFDIPAGETSKLSRSAA